MRRNQGPFAKIRAEKINPFRLRLQFAIFVGWYVACNIKSEIKVYMLWTVSLILASPLQYQSDSFGRVYCTTCLRWHSG